MSTRPKPEAAIVSAMSTGRAPRRYDRAGRIALLGEAAQALLAGRLPGREAALFLGGAVLKWLENGGDLELDYLQVRGIPGSHRTASQLWNTSSGGQQESEGADMVAASEPESEQGK